MNDTSQRPDEPPEDDTIVVGAGIDWTDPHSPLAPYYFQVSHVVLVAFLAFCAVAMTLLPVYHTDVWAHVRFGEEIVRTKSLPDREPFPESFADKRAPYVHYQWAAQAAAYLIFQAGKALSIADLEHQLGGGAMLLSTAHALVVVLRLLLLFWAFRRLTGSPAAACFGVVMVALGGSMVHLFILRPQILGELAFAAILLALSRPELSRRALLAVPLVFLVWANCHGSFPMGFVLLGAALAGRAVQVALDGGLRAVYADRQTLRLAAVLGLSLLATFANPHGPYLLYDSWALQKNPNIPTMEEWKSVPMRSAVNYVLVTSVVATLVLLRISPLRFTPTQVILLLGFGLQSVAHARVVVWWVMVVVWVLIPHLHAVVQRGLPAWALDVSVPSFRKTALGALLGVMMLAWSAPVWWLLWGDQPLGRQHVTAVTPYKAAELIRQRVGDGGEKVVFASETLGDFLLWDLRTDPPTRIICYTHVHLFAPDHWSRCILVKNAERGWQAQLDAWGVNYLVLEYDLYEQSEHLRAGRAPGVFRLIDRVRANPDNWRVLSEEPVFVAERVRP